MLQILIKLTAIKGFAKDIHYSAEGESFYGIHLLMDRVVDGLDGYIDSINEVAYMGKDMEPPASREVLKYATAYIPTIEKNNKADLARLDNLIVQTIDEVNAYDTNDRGENSLLDSIAQDLRLKHGLVSHCL